MNRAGDSNASDLAQLAARANAAAPPTEADRAVGPTRQAGHQGTNTNETNDRVQARSAIFAEPGAQRTAPLGAQPVSDRDRNMGSALIGQGAARALNMVATHGPAVGREDRRAMSQLEGIRNEISAGAIQTQHGAPETLERAQRLSLIVQDTVAVYERHAQTANGADIPANCWEQSMIALAAMAQQDNNPRLELVAIKATGGPFQATATGDGVVAAAPDHSLVVAGRNPDTDPLDPTTWNADTVICDPMVDRSYGVEDFPAQMSALSRFTGGSTAVQVMTFHPANTPFPPDLAELAAPQVQSNLTRASQRFEVDGTRVAVRPVGPEAELMGVREANLRPQDYLAPYATFDLGDMDPAPQNADETSLQDEEDGIFF